MKKNRNTRTTSPHGPDGLDGCCPFHRYLRAWFRARDPKSDTCRQLALLAHILHAHLDGADDQAIGIVFKPGDLESLGIGSRAEVMAALKQLAAERVLDVTRVRADEQGHVRGHELIVVTLPWLARP